MTSHGGYFKLKVTHLGEEYATTCIAFGATAEDLSQALNDLAIDYNQNGVEDEEDHVTVTRNGDGTASWGYGYQYSFSFEGPFAVDGTNYMVNSFGTTSSSIGPNTPIIEIAEYGSAHGCVDVGGNVTTVSEFTANTGFGKNGVANREVAGSYGSYIYIGESAAGVLAPGDRIRVEGSQDPYQTYTVASTVEDMAFEIVGTFVASSTGAGKTIYKVHGGLPLFAFKTDAIGTASFTYDIYFANPRVSNAYQLSVFNEGIGSCSEASDPDNLQNNEWEHYYGMVRDVNLDTVIDGGSAEVQVLTLAANEAVESGGYFAIFAGYNDLVNATRLHGKSYCFDWGVSEKKFSERLDSLLTTVTGSNFSQVDVTRSGMGAEIDHFGYSYTIKYTGDMVHGNMPPLFIETDLDTTNPTYSGTGVNDLTFTTNRRIYNGPDVLIITVEITDVEYKWKNVSTGEKCELTDTRLTRDCVKTHLNDTYQWRIEDELSSLSIPNPKFSSSGSSTDIEINPGVPKEIGNTGVFITFESDVGHKVGDKWVEYIVRCSDGLAKMNRTDVSITVDTILEGVRDVQELTLESSYHGKAAGTIEGVLVPQTFAVTEPSYEVQVITVQKTASSSWLSSSEYPAYQISLSRNDSKIMESTCVPYDATDRDLEQALRPYCRKLAQENRPRHHDNVFGYMAEVEEGEGGDCVSVTRREDAINAPNGYIYSVYFTGEFVKNRNIPQMILNTSAACSQYRTFKSHLSESVTIETAVDGYESTALLNSIDFTKNELPISPPGNPTAPGTYIGNEGELLPIYKMSGHYWTVQFETNLGDLSKMTVDASGLNSAAVVKVQDDIVKGVLPDAYQMNGLLTGVPYFSRVMARNGLGFSNYSNVDLRIAAEMPPATENLASDFALHLNEVQTITTSATHVDEVQIVTTGADYIPEVQEVTISAPEGVTIDGNFSLRFPEVQVIKVTAGSTIVAGAFKLNFTAVDFNTNNGYDSNGLAYTTQVTACIPFDATADEFEAALEATSLIDDVDVTRSGNGGAAYDFGYSWTVSFVGNNVAGNVILLDHGFQTCTAFDVPTGDYLVNVTSLNDGEALGTDTEIQTVQVQATSKISQGQYKLKLEHANVVKETSCLDWDATAEDVEKALEALSNVDSVRVDRSGAANKKSDFGYLYSIFFDGQGMMVQEDGTNNPDLLEVVHHSSCLDFATMYQGVLTDYTAIDGAMATVNVTLIDEGGFDLPAKTADPIRLIKPQLELLPNVKEVKASFTSLYDYELGKTYFLTFEEDGDIAQLACGTDDKFKSNSDRHCSVYTVVDGNVLGGNFILATSDSLSYDATEKEVELALEEVYGIGAVAVERSGPNGQLGYKWTITFLDYEGDFPMLELTSSLTGAGAEITVEEEVKGNELSGYFVLTYDNAGTELLAFDATADDIKNALEEVDNLGLVAVSGGLKIDTEFGRSWTVTFLSSPGDVPELRGETHSLGGVGSAVTVREVTKGSEAVGDSLHISYSAPMFCSTSQVVAGECGAPADKVIFEIDVNPKFQADPVFVEKDLDYTVQKVRISSKSLDTEFEAQSVSGIFQLSYEGEITPILNADATAIEVKHALESLGAIDTVTVERDFAAVKLDGVGVDATYGYAGLKCSAGYVCNFYQNGMRANDLVMVSGEWYRIASTYVDSESTLPLAKVSDSSIGINFKTDTIEAADLYGWTKGYEWTVTFAKVSGGKVTPLSSPAHNLLPKDSSVAIRVEDCNSCVYVSGLTLFTQYYVRARTFNDLGASPYSLHIAAMPMQIPSFPADISVQVVSGSELEVFFSPPTMPSGSIMRYTVQWDYDYTFKNAETSSASCSSSGYGSCEVEGSAIALPPPYAYKINSLTQGKEYYIRVAARNAVQVQSIDPTGEIVDNTNWCSTVDGVPTDQVPNMPGDVALIISSRKRLMVTIDPPKRDGGRNVSSYIVEYDTDSSFGSSAYVQSTLAAKDLNYLHVGGPLVHYIDSLTPGFSYYVRVSAVNAVGSSLPSYASTPIAPMGAPDAPALVTVDVVEVQDTPITEMTVMWDQPENATGNGGAAIDGYLIEWWTAATVKEVQEVRLYWESSMNETDKFRVLFGPNYGMATSVSTANVPYDVADYNLRHELMNIGKEQGSVFDSSGYVIGDVSVSRSPINNNKGYSWLVTFNDDAGLNAGDQQLMTASFSRDALHDKADIEVVEQIRGQRSHGNSEVQIVRISGTGDTDNVNNTGLPVMGFFRLSFYGSAYSQYLPADCSPEVMEDALELLSTVGQVQVTRHDVPADEKKKYRAQWTYEWRVTFETNVGNLPAMVGDGTNLYTSNGNAALEILDGDNAVDAETGIKAYDTVVGEAPVEYGSVVVGPDDRSYIIPELTPGTEYFVYVSSKNAFGISPRASSLPASLRPPKQVPGTPNDVVVSVNDGVSDSLVVSYTSPDSDGGDEIIRYRVELDPTDTFDAPVAQEDIECSTNNRRTVWEISTSGNNKMEIHGFDHDEGTQSVASDFTWSNFKLKVSVNGYDYITDAIPYDAVAMQADEVGVKEKISGFNLRFPSTGVNNRSVASASRNIFQGDRVMLSTSVNPEEIYTVKRIDGSDVYFVESVNVTSESNQVWRVHGGRGVSGISRIYCEGGDLVGGCDPTYSGSMQAKLETIDEAIDVGVNVIRTGPTSENGYTWRVTFLDDSPAAPFDYAIALHENNLYGNASTFTTSRADSKGTDVTITQLKEGKVHSTCTGSQIVPSEGGLVTGTEYFARVVAINNIGYGKTQAALSSQAPMVSPSKPTSVALSVLSSDSLQVVFNAPTDDGGDDVTAYLVEWSTSSAFEASETDSSIFTSLSGGAPFYKTISGLTSGVFYYVRVSAYNSQGYGSPALSTPTHYNPMQEPGAPTNVALGVTSDSMLTVSFDEPTDNGGDDITSYYIEWDTAASFNSLSSAPNKGTATVSSAEHNSYTITTLTENTVYYVRVSAINDMGTGASQTASPENHFPTKQIPGKPHTVQVASGSLAGEIDIQWQYPRVPAHGIPCSGTATDPDDCPAAVGSTLAESTGGDIIQEYEVEYNEDVDFSGQDGGLSTTDGTSLTLEGLTSGRQYYIRVLARNSVGSGDYCGKDGANCLDTGAILSATAK